jgi:hypothetical protein
LLKVVETNGLKPGQRSAARSFAAVACVLSTALAVAASADQTYAVSGSDSYSVGSGGVKSEISYSGRETLELHRRAGTTIYDATVRYTRVDQGASADSNAHFVAAMNAAGEERDVDIDDPDYLTLLNQPFAVQLDGATLRDLARLRAEVPFAFPSPITGSALQGRLRRVGVGPIAGMPAVGVSFEADGPIHGPLPDRPHLAMSGRIRMQGTAYYRSEDALLLYLDAIITISGNLTNPEQSDPVTIVYRRRLRAEPRQAAASH